jgi:hypothetical protein
MNARMLVGSILLVGFVTACSGTSTGTNSSSSGNSSSTSGGPTKPGSSAKQACLDTADAIADALTRCGGTYQANYDSFMKNAVNGSCDNVVSIRDESSLRGACFRYLSTATCTQLESLDASCKGQLQVSANGFEPELEPAGKAEGWAGVGAE